MLEPVFNKVVGLKASDFIKKIIQQRRFSVYLAKILRILFSTEHRRWLLLFTEVIIYLLLDKLHDCTFGPLSGLLTGGGGQKGSPP